jgi:catechol 2,3-dioxygenase-like lactoylglutathione lyase family enzyme
MAKDESTPKAGYVTPMLHVKDVEASVRFYELIGFTLIDDDGCRPIGWARMHCEGGALAFLRAEDGEAPMDPKAQAIFFYLYTPDLPAYREFLLAKGLSPAPIKHPPYMPSGEMHIKDPDGYAIFVGHWSEKEHSAWLDRLRKRKSG